MKMKMCDGRIVYIRLEKDSRDGSISVISECGDSEPCNELRFMRNGTIIMLAHITLSPTIFKRKYTNFTEIIHG